MRFDTACGMASGVACGTFNISLPLFQRAASPLATALLKHLVCQHALTAQPVGHVNKAE